MTEYLEQLAKTETNRLALVADDDAITRLLICRLMEQMGFIVVEASDGEEALRKYGQERPSVVITDVNMPKMDGLTASAEMQRIGGSSAVPIIVISGVDDRSVVNRAHEIGIKTYLSKPISLAALRQAVASALPAAGLPT